MEEIYHQSIRLYEQIMKKVQQISDRRSSGREVPDEEIKELYLEIGRILPQVYIVDHRGELMDIRIVIQSELYFKMNKGKTSITSSELEESSDVLEVGKEGRLTLLSELEKEVGKGALRKVYPEPFRAYRAELF